MALNILRSNRHSEAPLQSEWAGLFEPGVELEGRLKVASGMVRLNSQFKGEISSEGTILIAERGEVEANIQAKIVSIAGKVKGNVNASERLEIKEHGVLLGDIHTPVLIVEPGGYFEGQCQMPAPQSEKPSAQGIEPEIQAATDRSSSELQL
jgi:cytoskeletal protein CcmA (bactofilin family)